MRHHHFQVRIANQHVVGHHIEHRTRGLGQVFVARQRHIGNQLCVHRRGFVRMQDDDGILRVEVCHKGVQGGVAEVLSVAVGGQLDAVGPQHLQGVVRLLQSVRHIRQRQCGAEHKTPREAGLQRGTLLVVLSAHRRRSLRVAEEGLRRGHRQHRSLDAGLVHKGDVLLHVPARDGEPLVHFGVVDLDVVEVALRDGVAVQVNLSGDMRHKQYHKADYQYFPHSVRHSLFFLAKIGIFLFHRVLPVAAGVDAGGVG